MAALDQVARDVAAMGAAASTAQVDALDGEQVDRHADAVRTRAGSNDVAVNAVGILHVRGVPLGELSVDNFQHPTLPTPVRIPRSPRTGRNWGGTGVRPHVDCLAKRRWTVP